MRVEQEETLLSAGRLESATCAQLGERFQETDAHIASEKPAEISLTFILLASADRALISPNIPCTYMDHLAFEIDEYY